MQWQAMFPRLRSPIAGLPGVFLPLAIMLVVLSAWRLAFYVWQFDRVDAAGHPFFVLLQGLRFDLVTLAGAMLIPVSLTPLFMTSTRWYRRWKTVLLCYVTAWFALLMFMELATPSFIAQYDARPNYLFVEYLKHYREVGSTLLAQYPLQLLAAALIVPASAVAFFRVARRGMVLQRPLHWWTAIMLMPVLAIAFGAAARSSLGHRPANPSTVAVTPDHLVNDLALNSTYTVLYAIYLAQKDADGGFHYGEMPLDKVVDIVRGEMDPGLAFTDAAIPTLHHQGATRRLDRPYNLVIVLEESLGAEFVGRLGGLSLTPNLDRLGDEGIWFDNLYATGTRSVRGIEAVVSGFLPTPAVSVVKLNKAQHGFFTLAQLLRAKNYDTSFIYGGEAHFDNMRGFFLGNGFHNVIDQNDFDASAFRGSWGVSDEDLFAMAHQKFSQSDPARPFFALVFTSSNHAPFEFPDGRITLYDAEKQTVNNAVKYADHALGRFFDTARRSSYWDNTVFLVIADHNSRVYGSSLVPIERFHIPGVMLGGGLRPEVVTTLASQIDMAPTLLSLIGVAADHPMIGRDLSLTENRRRTGRAIMQFNAVQAYMEGDNVIVLQKELPPKAFRYQHGELREASDDPRLIEKAIAYSLFAQTAYAERLYRLP